MLQASLPHSSIVVIIGITTYLLFFRALVALEPRPSNKLLPISIPGTPREMRYNGSEIVCGGGNESVVRTQQEKKMLIGENKEK